MKRIFLLCFCILIHNWLYGQHQAKKNIITTRIYGPFKITTSDSTTISVKIDRVKFADKISLSESDISCTVIDSKGQVVFRNNYPADGEASFDIQVKPKYIPHLGNVLVLYYSDLPSYPDDGTSAQIFGFNSLNRFVALLIKSVSWKYAIQFRA